METVNTPAPQTKRNVLCAITSRKNSYTKACPITKPIICDIAKGFDNSVRNDCACKTLPATSIKLANANVIQGGICCRMPIKMAPAPKRNPPTHQYTTVVVRCLFMTNHTAEGINI